MQAPERQEFTFTREQFYEKLWTTPTTKIAKELGCSDVLIAKVCKAYRIPKPYLGYWAMLEHGKNPEKTPLEADPDPDIQTLTFYKYPDSETWTGEPKPEPEYDPDIQQILDRAQTLEPVTVAVSLHRPHAFVAAARDRIKAARAAAKLPFMERPHEDPGKRLPAVNVEVGESMTVRALCIMDALIKRIEETGGVVQVVKEQWNEWRTHTVVSFGGEEVARLRLREKHNQVRRPPDKEWSYPRTELVPAGWLILDEGPSYFSEVLLRDTPKHRRIEEGLNNLIVDLVKKAGRLRITRRKEEAAAKRKAEEEQVRQRQAEELRQRREELARRQKTEQARVDELVDHANSWRQSRIIREYLGALSDRLLERHGAIAIDSEAAQYLRWAHQQADRLDPLCPSPPSVLDERI
jgi:hypothetical protein